jgi:RNA polymerase sigma-70 factor (ECF subfamily)
VNQQELPWADLMRAANRGDTLSYHRLLAVLAPALRSFARRAFARSGLQADEVEDVVQETLLAVHLKRHTWDERQSLLPWVKAIARNKVIDALRRRGGNVHVAIDDIIETLADERTRDAGEAADLSHAVTSLKQRDREIVVAMSIEGANARDLAAKLGMTEGAVRVALHRALKTLARTLGSHTP